VTAERPLPPLFFVINVNTKLVPVPFRVYNFVVLKTVTKSDIRAVPSCFIVDDIIVSVFTEPLLENEIPKSFEMYDAYIIINATFHQLSDFKFKPFFGHQKSKIIFQY
jgi:hypothetical protein